MAFRNSPGVTVNGIEGLAVMMGKVDNTFTGKVVDEFLVIDFNQMTKQIL